MWFGFGMGVCLSVCAFFVTEGDREIEREIERQRDREILNE